MVITTSFAAVDDVLARALGAADTEVLSGSEFADDTRGDAFLLSQVGAFKAAMARGATVVLVDHAGIYESLYDVLNQRYVTKVQESGKRLRMLRIAVGGRSAQSS